MLFIMDFLMNVTLSGSFYKLSLTDGSNTDVKADNVIIHLIELHPRDGIRFFPVCYHSLVEVLLYFLISTSNDLNICEACDMGAQIYLNKICIKGACHLLSGNLITVFNLNENRLSNIYYLLSPSSHGICHMPRPL